MKNFVLHSVFVITLIFYAQISKSDVFIESGSIDNFAAAGVPGMNQLTFGSGSGQAGDFFLFTCVASSSSGMNSFNEPDPDIFTQREVGQCGPNTCVEGIWTGLTNSAGSVNVSCNTTQASILIAAGLLRYSNVDPQDPVIEIMCNDGTSTSATAPSINTEAGSQVVRIFNSSVLTEETFNDIGINPQAASYSSEATVDGGQVSTKVASALVNSDGPTGSAIQLYTGPPRDWTACTMALRMSTAQPTDPPPTNPPPTLVPPPTPPPTRNIPALSVWGNITLAVIALVFGAWYLRRKKVK